MTGATRSGPSVVLCSKYTDRRGGRFTARNQPNCDRSRGHVGDPEALVRPAGLEPCVSVPTAGPRLGRDSAAAASRRRRSAGRTRGPPGATRRTRHGGERGAERVEREQPHPPRGGQVRGGDQRHHGERHCQQDPRPGGPRRPRYPYPGHSSHLDSRPPVLPGCRAVGDPARSAEYRRTLCKGARVPCPDRKMSGRQVRLRAMTGMSRSVFAWYSAKLGMSSACAA